MAIKPQSTTPTTASELRELAEARLQQKQIAIPDLSTAADVMIRMIHEMEVYQIELEMQQEALTQSRDELVQSKKTIADSLERYTELYDFAPVGYLTLAPDGRILEANLTASHMLGVERSQLQGNQFQNFIITGAHSLYKAMLDAVFSQKKRGSCELVLLTFESLYPEPQDRHTPTVSTVRLEAAASDNGQECRVILSDISELKQTESELHRLSRALIATNHCNQALIHTSNEMELLQKICSIMVEVGGYRMAWVGYAEQNEAKSIQVVAQAGLEDGYIDTSRITWADERYGQGPKGLAIRTGKPFTIRDIQKNEEFKPWRREALERGYAAIQSLPLKSEHRVFGAITIYSEIPNAFDAQETTLLTALADNLAYGITMLRTRNAREQAEQQLKKLSVAIEQSPAIVVITDPLGNIEYVNPMFTHVTGFSAEEARGKKPSILKSGLMPKSLYETLWKTILSGKVWCGELQNKKKNGELYWDQAVIAGIQNQQGEITNFVAVKLDITQQKKMLQELIAAKEHAEESDRLKSAFLANISHEIRTPMNGILGFSALLKEPHLTGEEQEEYLDLIEQSGQRMLNLINDLIDISRIEAGETKLQITPTTVNKVLHDLYAFFMPAISNKKLQLHCTLGLPDNESIIDTDSGKLAQILTNLIQNALKFTRTGTIDFGYTRQGTTLEFYVTDTGIGIPDDMQQKIFDRFHQVDNTLTRNHEGSGLGLSISKAYVAMLGGTFKVKSTEGTGSTFSFNIPFNPVHTQPSVSGTQHSVLSTQHSEHCILIVEDDEVSTLLLKKNLKGENITMLCAENGLEAVEVVQQHPEINLVLMDLKMPIMNGFEATKLIKHQRPELPVIAQSAFTSKEDKEKAKEAGCDNFITKPISKSELLDMMAKLLV